METKLLCCHPSFKKREREREMNFCFYLPFFSCSGLHLGYFLVTVSKWTSLEACLQNFPLPFERTGQAQLRKHNKDEFPGLNTICNKVPLPEQETQREGFTATWQIRARKQCQSKHNYWEGSALTTMTVRRVSYHGWGWSHYCYARWVCSYSHEYLCGAGEQLLLWGRCR